MNQAAFFSVVIVTYYPGQRFLDNIEILNNSPYLSNVIVVDNTGEENTIISIAEKKEKVIVLRNKYNEGIASAQNRGIALSSELGYKWVLTFDHDSIARESLIYKYVKYLTTEFDKDIAIIGSDYEDENGVGKSFVGDSPLFVTETISSGALINLDVYMRIGKFREDYFIDQVDNEYCYRVIKEGYKIIILPGKDMTHQMGNMTCKYFFGHKMVLYNQSPIRTYYRTRNIIRMLKEYRNRDLRITKTKDLVHDLIRLAFEKKSLQKYYYFTKGFMSGIRG